MKSRMHTRKNKTREQTLETTAQGKPMFQSRPFVVESQSDQKVQNPDLKTPLKQAERYGHHLKKKQQTGFSTELGEQEWKTNENSKTEPIQKMGKNSKSTSSKKDEEKDKNKESGDEKQDSGEQKALGKKENLKKKVKENPDKVPSELVNENKEEELIKKVNPTNAGDHTPSLSAVNKSRDPVYGERGEIIDNAARVNIPGRGHSNGQNVAKDAFIETEKEKNVPTMHFGKKNKETNKREEFKKRNLENYEMDAIRRRTGPLTKEEHEKVENIKNSEKTDGAKAHTELTSIREAASVGEEDSMPIDDLLDKTMNAYRGRDLTKQEDGLTPDVVLDDNGKPKKDASGNDETVGRAGPKREKVVGRSGTNLRVDVRKPGNKDDNHKKEQKSRLVRHEVHPMIAQGIINSQYYRPNIAEASRTAGGKGTKEEKNVKLGEEPAEEVMKIDPKAPKAPPLPSKKQGEDEKVKKEKVGEGRGLEGDEANDVKKAIVESKKTYEKEQSERQLNKEAGEGPSNAGEEEDPTWDQVKDPKGKGRRKY